MLDPKYCWSLAFPKTKTNNGSMFVWLHVSVSSSPAATWDEAPDLNHKHLIGWEWGSGASHWTAKNTAGIWDSLPRRGRTLTHTFFCWSTSLFQTHSYSISYYQLLLAYKRGKVMWRQCTVFATTHKHHKTHDNPFLLIIFLLAHALGQYSFLFQCSPFPLLIWAHFLKLLTLSIFSL